MQVLHTYVYIYILHTHIYIYISLSIYIYTLCTYMCILCMYTYIHIYTHTWSPGLGLGTWTLVGAAVVQDLPRRSRLRQHAHRFLQLHPGHPARPLYGRTSMGLFCKLGGPFLGCPCNQIPSILWSMLGPPFIAFWLVVVGFWLRLMQELLGHNEGVWKNCSGHSFYCKLLLKAYEGFLWMVMGLV